MLQGAPLATKWAPICHLAVPLIKDRTIADFLSFLFDLFWTVQEDFFGLRVVGQILGLAYYLAVLTRKAKCSVGLGGNPKFEKLADLRHIWPY